MKIFTRLFDCSGEGSEANGSLSTSRSAHCTIEEIRFRLGEGDVGKDDTVKRRCYGKVYKTTVEKMHG